MARPVIFVVESSGLCGGVRQILEQARGLSARGWPIAIFSVDRKPMWFALPAEVEWRTFPDYKHLQTALVAEDDIKVATWWKTAAIVNGTLRGTEGCYLTADIETSYYSRPGERELVTQTYGYPLSRYTESRWVEQNLPNTTWVGIGLDHELHRPLDLERATNTVMAISRRQRLKGFRQLGELSRRLGNCGVELITIGLQPTRFAGAWRRHYTGLGDLELARLYGQIGCFVSTTRHEGLGLPHLEAMACGTPVVTTDADGNMEFCRHGYNCLVFDRDDMVGMAIGIVEVLSNDKLRETLVAGGLETAAGYTWPPVIDRLEDFFGSI